MWALLRASLAIAVVALTGCGGDDAVPATTAEVDVADPPTVEMTHPEVVEVEPTDNGDGTWDFAVTLSSPYDSPERYADGWRIVGPDGTVYGEHTLAHDHAAEQPFTRTQRGVTIPETVAEVTVEGRDTANGFGGATMDVDLAERRS